MANSRKVVCDLDSHPIFGRLAYFIHLIVEGCEFYEYSRVYKFIS